MSSASGELDEKLAAWLKKSLAKIPPKIDLLLLEWNTGWPSTQAHRAREPKSLLFTLTGFQHGDAERFDPENPDHLDELSEPAWEVSKACDLPQAAFNKLDPSSFVKRVLTSVRKSIPALSKIDLAYGEHEGDLKVFKSARKTSVAKAQGLAAFFELHLDRKGNNIEEMELGDYDDNDLMDYNRVSQRPAKGVQLFLQKKPRLLDFLFNAGGWLVCSQRRWNFSVRQRKRFRFIPPTSGIKRRRSTDTTLLISMKNLIACPLKTSFRRLTRVCQKRSIPPAAIA